MLQRHEIIEKLATELNFSVPTSFTTAPLLLCGIERGGTGIGARIVGSHPNINWIRYGGSSRFDGYFYQNINRLGKGLAEQIFSKIVMQGREKILANFSDYSGNTSPYHQAIRAAFASTDQYVCFYNLLALLETIARGDQIQPHWLDKAIGLGIGRRFLRHFPDGRLIYLLRDPRDIVTSQLGIRKQVEQSHSPYKVSELSVTVRRHFKEAYQLQQRFGERVWIIRHEDLISDPIKTTEPIFTTMGIRKLSADDLLALNSGQNKASHDRSITYHGISTKNIYRWKHEHNPDLHQRIQIPLKKWLTKTGYELSGVKINQSTTLKVQTLSLATSVLDLRNYIPQSLKYKLRSLMTR